MPGKRTKPNPKKSHAGKKGNVYQNQGQTTASGRPKGHDLLTSDSQTAGVGASVGSPSEQTSPMAPDEPTSEPDPALDPGPGPGANPGAGSFASEGGYGPGPTGRGPYNQPYTYSTSKEADLGISDLSTEGRSPDEIEAIQKRADAANEEGQRPRTIEQERIEHLGEPEDETRSREAPRVPTDTWTED